MYLGALATTAEGPLAGKFGFFGVLPDWQDVEGTCAEIDFLFAEQRLCSGVGAYTTYGDRLPGHESFGPIWQRLQAHGALVFLHPRGLELQPKFIGGFFPQPIVDYPLATTRAAVDLKKNLHGDDAVLPGRRCHPLPCGWDAPLHWDAGHDRLSYPAHCRHG